ncbi:hypothetical protein Tco_1265441 [Tanacetum coccineum]
MGDENLIRTLGDYSKPSHEGYKNTIELPEGNNVVPLQSDTICNWLERLPARSISTWKDFTTRFLPQFFPPGRRTIDQSAGGKLRDRNVEESWALLEDLALYDNKSWNDPRDFAKPVKAISLPQDVPSTSDRRLIELENQVQRLMEAHLAPKLSVQVNKISSSCEICSGPHDTQYYMENPEQAFFYYASSRIDEVGGDSIAYVNDASIDQIEKEDLRNKGIKSLSKLLSLEYLSQASLEEQNRNPSSPKRVHFINFVVILCKEDEVREEENVKPNATKYNDHEMTAKAEEKVEEESEDEFEEEIKEEEEEEEEEDKQAYIDLESPVNVMYRLHYNWITSEDTTSVIDHDLGAVVFRKPFVEKTRLIYDKKEGTVAFTEDNERLIFKMPHKMEMFKNVNFMGVSTDRIPPSVIGGDDNGNEKNPTRIA